MNRSTLVSTLLVAMPCMLASSVAQAGCFFMYDTRNALVYQSPTSPIDLSRSVSDEMARRFPSRALVIATTTACSDDTTVTGPASRYVVGDPYAASDNTSTPRPARRAYRRR